MSSIDTTKIKNKAYNILKGKWGEVIPITLIAAFLLIIIFIFYFIIAIKSYYFFKFNPSVIILLALYPPIIVGYYKYFLNFNKSYLDFDRADKNYFKILFIRFKRNYLQTFLTYLLHNIYVNLWTLLLIVPGIIKSIAYSQVYFIIAEDEEISANNAIKKSQAMMKGHKMEFFELIISFVLCYLLSIITLGIGFIWTIPYMVEAKALFYKEVKKQYEDYLL
ncbi:MAG: DUF975 family protein [Bacteroidetes bacterium]|nr:DUF975 family protein [Bacteroidota bacterium]